MVEDLKLRGKIPHAALAATDQPLRAEVCLNGVWNLEVEGVEKPALVRVRDLMRDRISQGKSFQPAEAQVIAERLGEAVISFGAQ